MAAPEVGNILLVPGRLAAGPTDLSLAWPHGGTGLGLVQDVVLRPARTMIFLREEAFGSEITEALDMGEAWILACAARTHDRDLLQRAFASTIAGASSEKRNVTYPGTFRAGTLRSTATVKLLFTPDDPDRHDFVILYNAMPYLPPEAEVPLSRSVELTYPVVFQGIRDATDRVVRWGPKEDIAL